MDLNNVALRNGLTHKIFKHINKIKEKFIECSLRKKAICLWGIDWEGLES
jgi:hypothetical protein